MRRLFVVALMLVATSCNGCDTVPTCGFQVLVLSTNRIEGGRVQACVGERCHTLAFTETFLRNSGVELNFDLDHFGLWPDTIERPGFAPTLTTFPGRQGFDVRLTVIDSAGQIVTTKQVRSRRRTAPCSCPYYSARI